MRVLWHGPHPDMPTGYANQARQWASYLVAAGYDVGYSCLAGPTSAMSAWKTGAALGTPGAVIPVYPCTPYENLGQDVVAGHYKHFRADLIISLTCTWVYNPLAWRDMRTIFLTPVDVAPLPGREGMSPKDYAVIEQSGGTPGAVCRYGERMMRASGLTPLYLPHGVDTTIFTPPRSRKQTRQGKNIDHMFIIGINAMNHERARKNFNEAFGAFAGFRARHPNSLLALHTMAILPEGLHLPRLAEEWGITDACMWSDQYQLATGAADWTALADWYGTIDVLLSLGNEGFGLPVVEAQACGTPVIAGDWGPGPELAGDAGWLVDGQPEWNNWHGKHWRTPFITSVEAALEAAYREAGDRRAAARAAALDWDTALIWDEYWAPVIKGLAG